MAYQQFEDLPVWKEAIVLVEEIYRISSQPGFKGPASFRSQIERAALSVSNNVAEGFERGTTPELITFLYIARGSAGEVRSMLRLLERNRQWGGGNVSKAVELAVSCAKQIRTWAQYLQDGEIKGQRYLGRKSKEENVARARTEAFRKRVFELLPAEHPLRREAQERELDAKREKE